MHHQNARLSYFRRFCHTKIGARQDKSVIDIVPSLFW